MAKSKDERILIIVESPNKCATIRNILKDTPYKDAIIMASVGHITEISNTGLYNMGIDVKNDFKADYVVSDSKKEIVKKLKDQVKIATKIYIASDGDREGEDIAHHLKEVLKIPNSKYERITYQEITKKAILYAIEHSRKIDYDLVEASESRQKIDKIIGYRISPITRQNNVGRSAGRCQSAGLKLLVEKEESIRAFIPETYYDVILSFTKDNTEFKAKYFGYIDKEIKEVKQIKTQEQVQWILDNCKKHDFTILNVEHKDTYEYPKFPFCTSTLQQEASKKLGIGVKEVMSLTQKLFEGINVDGQHIALITYHRTDSQELGKDFLPTLETFVKSNYTKDYYSPVRKPKKSENEQDGHEAIRPVDLSMTPEKLSQYVKIPSLIRLYTIIYKRTVAAAMKPAVISNTIYTIQCNNQVFIMTSKEVTFDGYRKVYTYSDDNDEDTLMITFKKNEKLKDTKLSSVEKQTKPPARYTEATFIKELEKQGIGRPSTYATIVSTILDESRGYCEVKEKCLVPTEKGITLSHFLDEHFPDIINLHYTAELEKDLDLIANGKLNSLDFLKDFYSRLETAIGHASKAKEDEERVCPECGAKMVVRFNKATKQKFYGCSNYPNCRHAEKY